VRVCVIDADRRLARRRLNLRRQEILDGTLQVVSALRETSILDALQELLSRQHETSKSLDNEAIFEAYSRYLLASHQFGVAARKIVLALGLEKLEQGKFWAAGMGEPGPSRDTVVSTWRTATFTIEYLPKLLTLLRFEDLPSHAPLSTKPVPSEILTVVLPEDSDEHSTP
jgi:hypothetical protein